jgi:hypothetical protein
MLQDVVVHEKINFTATQIGLDSIKECKNLEWFNNYPYAITYNYNSRGFRDCEWPIDLKNSIWCIGDSFTLGLGVPYEHTWPYLLSTEVSQSVINVSLNGASNDWISRMSRLIKKEINPYAIIHQWSYIHRRELIGNVQSWFDNNTTTEEDVENFIKNIKSTVDDNNIHSFVPLFEPPYDHAKNRLEKEAISNVIYDNNQLDYARDYHHYDIITAKKYVEYYKEILDAIK